MIFDAENMKVWYMETINGNSEQLYWNVEKIEKDNEFENIFYWKVNEKYYPLKTIELNLNDNKVSIGGDIYIIGKNKIVTGDWIQNKLNEIEEKNRQDKIEEEKFQTKLKEQGENEAIRWKYKQKVLPHNIFYDGYFLDGYIENDTTYYVIYYKISNSDSIDYEKDFNLSFYLNKRLMLSNSSPYQEKEIKKDYERFLGDLRNCFFVSEVIKHIEKMKNIIKLCDYCVLEKQNFIEFWNKVYVYFFDKNTWKNRYGKEWNDELDKIKILTYKSLPEIIFGTVGTKDIKKEMDKSLKWYFENK